MLWSLCVKLMPGLALRSSKCTNKLGRIWSHNKGHLWCRLYIFQGCGVNMRGLVRRFGVPGLLNMRLVLHVLNRGNK